MKLTEWFPSDVKPVHTGWYKYQFRAGYITFAWWDGENWTYSGSHFQAEKIEPEEGDKWRGLAEKL